jgi:hypothetical protein
MRSGVRLIQNRKILLAILVLSVFGTVESWHWMASPAARYDLVHLLGLMLSTLICAFLAIRTTFIGDRIVVAPIAIAFALSTAIRLLFLDQQTVYVIRAAIWLMWATSLFAGIYVLVPNRKGWFESPRDDERKR